jgi:acetolactate synthase-1/2/3 large subunit
MWVAQSLPIRSPRQLLTSGGLGSMGFGLPAAMIVLFDNRQLGLVRQQQTLFYGNRLHACAFEKHTDFVAVARGFGVEAYDLRLGADSVSTLQQLLKQRGPRLTRVPLMAAEMVLPMVPPGAGNCEMLGMSAATSPT